ncbi:cation:proton antiporter domain-containing protein [Aquicella lusitana]|uniref:Transporter (CPA2 family) n=1 Tax=Aquicella lusitana TaxID=254246 RepID=A0A370GLQ1_9COXI|nr:cation:proton antiporter [Aquicella lusitana]RDI44577.1 transporter (CPA2 family) [Aquicella lusitana]VVC72481.1 Inner membrane protein YbaL [Aquicella lusitana]
MNKGKKIGYIEQGQGWTMQEVAPLIYDLAVMLGVAGIVVLLFQRIHQPVVLGYLVAGMIIGPYTPPYAFINDVPNIQLLSELGVIFLMFSLGLEFSFHKLKRVGFSASMVGLIEVVLMFVIGYIAGKILGWPHYDCLFLGAALSISSTTIIIKAIDELKLKTKRFAELIFGVLIVEDLLAILLLVALSTVVITKNIFSFNMVIAAIKLIIVVGGWFLIGYFLVPPLFRRIANYISQETLTIISVALCLFLVCVAAYFHYSTALGAFIMGSILAETVLIRRIEELIWPIRDIFAAVFFISVGMLIDTRVIVDQWQAVLLITCVTILGKILTTSVGALLTGQSLNTSLRAGFSMAQIGEFSFIIVALGVALQVTGNALYPIVVAVSGITTFTTPYLIRFSSHISDSIEKRLPERTKYFLDGYSAWVYRTLIVTQEKSLFGKTTTRLIINGMIVAIIFTFIDQVVFPRFIQFVPNLWLSNIICLLIALAIASPFIWGMLFSFRAANIPSYAKTYLNPAVFIIWFITLSELAILSIVFFHTWLTIVLFVCIATVFFLVSYKQLERSYHWFEKQLVNNIGKENASNLKYEELAPWDTHLVEIEVGELSPFAGKSVGECHIRHTYGINIVAICHGLQVIPAPRGEEKIQPGDKLIVLGNDEQIDLFKQQAEMKAKVKEPASLLANFTLQAFLLDKKHALVGQSIRASHIRESVNGIVVGLERDNIRILNPDPETILKADDLLLVVGEANKIKRLDFRS